MQYTQPTIRLMDVLMTLIERRPGQTEIELAKIIYGPSGYQQLVNQYCRLLEGRGLVERKLGDEL